MFLEKNPFVQILLDAGADVETGSRDRGMTPLHHAAGLGNLCIVNVRHMISPLLSTHEMLLQLLLDNGAAKTAKDIRGNIPRDYLCLFREVHCFPLTKLLLGLLLNPDEHFY